MWVITITNESIINEGIRVSFQFFGGKKPIKTVHSGLPNSNDYKGFKCKQSLTKSFK
jgi:hypothetical protein